VIEVDTCLNYWPFQVLAIKAS